MAYGIEVLDANGAIAYGVDDTSLLLAEVFTATGPGTHVFTMASNAYSYILVCPIVSTIGATITHTVSGFTLTVSISVISGGTTSASVKVLCME